MATITQSLKTQIDRLDRQPLGQFFLDGFREVTSGGTLYHAWMAALTFVICLGASPTRCNCAKGWPSPACTTM